MKNCEQIGPNLVDWPYNPDGSSSISSVLRPPIWFKVPRPLVPPRTRRTKMGSNLPDRAARHGAWSHVYPLEAQCNGSFPTSKLGFAVR